MYQAKARPSGLKRLVVWLGSTLGIVVALCLVLLAVLWVVARRDGYSIGIDTGPRRHLLVALEDSAGLSRSAAEPVSWTPVEGTTPDMSSRSYVVSAAAPVRVAVTAACRSQHLLAPGASDRRMMPDMVCQGSWKGKDVTVELHDRCDKTCRIILSVDAI